MSGRGTSPLRQAGLTLDVATDGAGLYEITRPVLRWVEGQGILQGLLTLFVRHTSASLIVQENADPSVRHDLETFFRRLVPEDETPGRSLYRHQDEGPDDMPAHIRAALTACQLSIPVAGGAPVLGTWQGIYLFEHRHRPHRRQVVLHLLGE